jgi:hypothetical protein
MRDMLSQTGNEALSREDGQRWIEHLRCNAGLEIVESGEEFRFPTKQGEYHPLNPALRSAASPGQGADHEHLRYALWEEVTKTIDVQRDLYLLAWKYGIVPGHHDLDDWAPNAIERQLERVAACVIYESFRAPLIPWPVARLVPYKTGQGVERAIRLERWLKPLPPGRRKTLHVRVKVWMIYYLTSRGGGRRIEDKAVEIWNNFSNDELKPSQYRRQRLQLFKHGTKTA